MLTPWPITRFLHGGQLRAAAIAAAYRARGHEVLVRGYHDAAQAAPGDAGPEDYPIPPAIERHYADADRGSEFRFSRALAAMPEIVEAYAARARAFRPDLLQFEEPYLWPLARALRDRLGRIPVLYSSYNFETEAKRELRRAGAAVTDRTLADVAATEAEIAREADGIVAVSAADIASFRAIGARRVILAPNGTERRPVTAEGRRAAAAYVGDEPFALFVSSAHPPNALGVIELAAAARRVTLGRGALLVCGGVATLLQSLPGWNENHHIFARARLLGVTSPDLLAALCDLARVIVLPKTAGGGSSLKTAEALLTDRPIIATTRAFDGYEAFRQAPGVHLADDGEAFWAATRDLLAKSAVPPVPRSEAMRSALLWDACLTPLVEGAAALCRELAASA